MHLSLIVTAQGCIVFVRKLCVWLSLRCTVHEKILPVGGDRLQKIPNRKPNIAIRGAAPIPSHNFDSHLWDISRPKGMLALVLLNNFGNNSNSLYAHQVLDRIKCNFWANPKGVGYFLSLNFYDFKIFNLKMMIIIKKTIMNSLFVSQFTIGQHIT